MLKIFIIAILIMFVPNVMAASPRPSVCPSGQICTDLGDVSTASPLEFVSNIYGIGLGLIGGVALLAIIYGGYLILSSQGEPRKIQDGKQYIFYAIIGMFMAFAGFAIYGVIGGSVLKIPGF
jgi:hypothetical protein